MTETFWNPYAFVPFAERRSADGWSGLERLRESEISGTIDLDFRVVTPLLCLDESTRRLDPQAKGHPIFSVIRDPRNPVIPWIPPASFKGALRSGYEAITGSRVPFFDRRDRLGYRRAIRDAAQATPAQILGKDGDQSIRLLLGALHTDDYTRGSTTVTVECNRREAKVPLLPAAFIGVSMLEALASAAELTSMDELAGAEVTATKMVLYLHRDQNGRADFAAYVVTELQTSDGWAVERGAGNLEGQRWETVSRVITGPSNRSLECVLEEISGRLLITGASTATNKHEERFAFALTQANERVLDTDEAAPVLDTWRMVIESYLESHDLRPSSKIAGPGPMGNVLWARHLRDPKARQLVDGSMVWCALDEAGRPAVLTPVSSSRDLYVSSPLDLLGPNHRPAAALDEASPADRLFGWVAEEGTTRNRGQRALRGRLSIVDLHHQCDGTTECAHINKSPITLAELSSPKPQYGRFYLTDETGSSPKSSKKKWFNADEQSLAGRKFYWFHERVVGRKPPRTLRNRTAAESVEEGTRFRVRLRIEGARAEDLAALLDLLAAITPDSEGGGSFLQLGFGKPLGYGSVQLQSVSTRLRTGDEWRERLSELDFAPATRRSLADTRRWINPDDSPHKTSTVASAFTAWRTITAGPSNLHGGIHYPWSRPGDDGYKWFMANERSAGGPAPARGIAANGQPIPLRGFETDQRPGRGGGRPRGGGGRPDGNGGRGGGGGKPGGNGGRGGGGRPRGAGSKPGGGGSNNRPRP